MPIDMAEYMPVTDCAATARVCPLTIRRWMNEGRFRWIRKNRRARMAHKEEFMAFIASLHNPTLPQK